MCGFLKAVAQVGLRCSELGSVQFIRSAMALGFLLCTAWYFTILSGFFTLYCPVMYLMFLNQQLYRKVIDSLFALWELYPVALFQCCFKTKLHHFGDYVDRDEKAIIIMNHRTRVDWNYVWIALYYATQNPSDTETCICKEKQVVKTEGRGSSVFDIGGKSKIKFVLKDELKIVPGLGWIMQLNYFLYVKRDWREDQLSLSQFVDYYRRLRTPCRLVLFPEGTDLSDENRRRSDKFAVAHNLSKYEFVLHPRTTGWAALCSRMRTADDLESVYDVTVAYDTPAQTEADLLRGKLPTHVYFHIKRYPIEQLPYEDNTLREWLNKRWQEKEANLSNFHVCGSFLDSTTKKMPKENLPRSMTAAKLGFVFWTVIDLLFVYGLIHSLVFQFWVMYHCLLFVFVTWYFGGFHNIQYKLLDKLRR